MEPALGAVMSAIISLCTGVLTLGAVWKLMLESTKERLDNLEKSAKERLDNLEKSAKECELERTKFTSENIAIKEKIVEIRDMLKSITVTKVRKEDND